jgi:hypothetical protein
MFPAAVCVVPPLTEKTSFENARFVEPPRHRILTRNPLIVDPVGISDVVKPKFVAFSRRVNTPLAADAAVATVVLFDPCALVGFDHAVVPALASSATVPA